MVYLMYSDCVYMTLNAMWLCESVHGFVYRFVYLYAARLWAVTSLLLLSSNGFYRSCLPAARSLNICTCNYLRHSRAKHRLIVLFSSRAYCTFIHVTAHHMKKVSWKKGERERESQYYSNAINSKWRVQRLPWNLWALEPVNQGCGISPGFILRQDFY